MISLNGVKMEPAEAREILKYLADNLGLAPEEARPAAFEVEKQMIDYKYPDKDTDSTCSKCHSMGRVISQRRTKSEWELLIAMHRGYYPLSDFQAFRRLGPPRDRARPGRPPARQSSPHGKGDPGPGGKASAEDAGMVRVGSEHARAEARRAMGVLRLPDGQRVLLRRHHHQA